MPWEQLFKAFRKMFGGESTQKSSVSWESFASSLPQSPALSSKPSWKTKAVEQIRRHEGEVLHAYQDHLGWWTIGVGRLIDKRKGGGITREESDYLLNNDVTTRLSELERRLPWFNELNDARKAVLLNMSFQMGVAGLMGFTKTLAHVKAGEYLLAADSMLQSKWANQTPRRANELADQMRYGKWQSG
jgi:lysozyme